MGQAVTDSVSDPNSKRFRLLPEEEGTPPVTQTQGAGKPPAKPPIAPASAEVPEPEPPKRINLELEVMELKKENDELICALYYLQQELKDLRGSK